MAPQQKAQGTKTILQVKKFQIITTQIIIYVFCILKFLTSCK